MNNIVPINQDALAAIDAFAAGNDTAQTNVTYLKFAKGEWVAGQEESVITVDYEFAANMATLSNGFICWKDGRVAGEEMGIVVSGLVPRKNELTDIPGSDGWAAQSSIELQDLNSGETYLFKSSSKGGVGAIATLAKAFSTQMKSGAAETVPAICLACDSYKHKDYGKIYTPVFEIFEWLSPGDVDAAPTEPEVVEAELVVEPEPEPEPEPEAAKPKRVRKSRRKVAV